MEKCIKVHIKFPIFVSFCLSMNIYHIIRFHKNAFTNKNSYIMYEKINVNM